MAEEPGNVVLVLLRRPDARTEQVVEDVQNLNVCA